MDLEDFSKSINNFNKTPIYVYIHVCCINNYKSIFRDLIYCIKNSNLYNKINEIRCCVLGVPDKDIFDDDKTVVVAISDNLLLRETFTINKLYEDSKKEEFYCLYLHTKGVTRNGSIFVKSWVDYMCYFTIDCCEKCIELLNDNDTVGVNLQDKVGEECHYSGNYWWTKSSYIKLLSSCPSLNYNDPEFWLTRNKNGKYVGLWHSNYPHMSEIYNKETYINKEIVPYVFDYTSSNIVSYLFSNNIFESLSSSIKDNIENILTVENNINIDFEDLKQEYSSPSANIYKLYIYQDEVMKLENIANFDIDKSLDIIIDNGNCQGIQAYLFIILNKFLSKNGMYIIKNVSQLDIDKFIDLTIFSGYINVMKEKFSVKYFDTRNNNLPYGFMVCITYK
jgi:hypothetical protein